MKNAQELVRLGLPVLFALSVPAGVLASYADQKALDQNLRQEAMRGAIPRVEELRRAGADINAKALYGESALDDVIRTGRIGVALQLIDWGADPNSEDSYGVTPLLRAASDPNSTSVVKALLLAGADVNHRDLYGRTALINAAHYDCVQTILILLTWAKNVIDVDARDISGQSATDLAREGAVPELLEMTRRFQHGDKESGSKIQARPRI